MNAGQRRRRGIW